MVNPTLHKTLLGLRVGFVGICTFGGWLVGYAIPEWDAHRLQAMAIGFFLGLLVVLVDVLLRGISLRALTAATFGLAVGSLASFLIGSSPLFQYGDPQLIYLSRLSLFLVCSYIGTVLAVRGRNEFNLVIPYVKFVPHNVESPLIVVDTSALIDGRIARLCESGIISSALIIPRFVLNELQRIADSPEPQRRQRGRRGLDVLNQLRAMKGVELRVHDAEIHSPGEIDTRLIFVAQSLKAKLLTLDANLAKLAQFQGVPVLNLLQVARALAKEWSVGEQIQVDLVRPGKEEGQAVGFVEDGSMVVVNDGRSHIGQRSVAEIVSIVPSGAGRILFGRWLRAAEPSGPGPAPVAGEGPPPAQVPNGVR